MTSTGALVALVFVAVCLLAAGIFYSLLGESEDDGFEDEL